MNFLYCKSLTELYYYNLKVNVICAIMAPKEMTVLDLLQLKYFCDAAETQNFSKTAKRFFVPTSNISQTVKRLEKELETALFVRTGNKVTLNESGFLFYKKAKAALDLLESARKAMKHEPSAEIIKMNIHINRRIVMDMIEKFRKQHPEVSFVTTHTTVEDSDEFDIIVTDKDLHIPYMKTRAAEEALLLAYHKDAFPFHGEIRAADLKNAHFIAMNNGSSLYENTIKICNSLGFTPHIVLQGEDPFYVRKCIELGLGISIVPELSWRGQLSENVKLKTIGDYKRSIYIYKKHGMNESVNQIYDLLINGFHP